MELEPRGLNPKRPPADEIITEFFFDKKCGTGDTHDRFYDWCSSGNTTIRNVTCEGVGGDAGICTFEGKFSAIKTLADSYGYLQDYMIELYRAAPSELTNSTSLRPDQQNATVSNSDKNLTTAANTTATTTTTTLAPEVKSANYEFYYNHVCDFGGPSKMQNRTDRITIDRSTFEKIKRICYQEMHGAPYSLPWWMIVIIVMLVIMAVGTAASLFWKYWLRRRVYGRRTGEPTSDLGSMWTSAPFSSSSIIQGGPSQGAWSGARERSSSNRGSTSGQGTSKAATISSGLPTKVSQAGSLRSAQVSKRSSLSRSTSKRRN